MVRRLETNTNEGRSPSVTLCFEWDIYQFVELDELILVVCFVFPDTLQFLSSGHLTKFFTYPKGYQKKSNYEILTWNFGHKQLS